MRSFTRVSSFLLLPLLVSCAPEAFNNRAATGFNAFIDQVSSVCKPVQLGPYQLYNPLMGGVGNNSYDYWLNQSSRLYYRKISPAAYRESINAFFNGGNDATIDCIIGQLPARQ